MIPLMSAVVAYVAYQIFPYSKNEWMFLVPSLDPSIWSMLLLPFFLPYYWLREANKNSTTTEGLPPNDR